MVIAALIAGWIVYMIAMILTIYDGLLSLIFQPIMGLLASVLFVGAALIAGVLFRIPALGRIWRSSWMWAAGVVFSSIFLMCFGSMLGLRQCYLDPETGQQFAGLHSGVALASYFALLFAITHWPLKKGDAA